MTTGIADGSLRSDIASDDVTMMGLGGVLSTGPAAPVPQMERLFDALVDGLLRRWLHAGDPTGTIWIVPGPEKAVLGSPGAEAVQVIPGELCDVARRRAVTSLTAVETYAASPRL